MKRPRLGELELAIMNFIWGRNAQVTVPGVHAHLSRKRTLAYTTTMTVMTRLYEKGLLERIEERRPYNYRPAVKREEYSAQRMLDVLSEVADRRAVLARFVEKIGKKDMEALLDLARKARSRRR